MTPNYNQMVHQYFFSSSVLTVHPPATESAFSVLSESFDRLTRYERSLSNRYRQDFEMEIAGDTSKLFGMHLFVIKFVNVEMKFL